MARVQPDFRKLLQPPPHLLHIHIESEVLRRISQASQVKFQQRISLTSFPPQRLEQIEGRLSRAEHLRLQLCFRQLLTHLRIRDNAAADAVLGGFRLTVDEGSANGYV